MVRLEDVDDDPLDGEDGCTFLLGLMQKDGRRQKMLDRNLETIGFAIYKVSPYNVTFQFRFFWINILRKFSKNPPQNCLFPACRCQNRYALHSPEQQSVPPVTEMSASESRVLLLSFTI